jgi:lysophospholipase L1-like esterase
MHTRDDRGTCLLFSDEVFYHRQTLATYTHQPGLWRGVVPRFAGAELPRTSQRLRERVPLTICLTGDSISEGYNASGFMQAAPFQPSYGPLVAEGLRVVYGAPIVFHNCATAGWNSDEAVWDADRLGGMSPDLVIIAYGMNDAGYNEVSDFARNIAHVIDAIRRGSPEAEFVLVSSMLPHAEWEYPVMARFAEYRDALARLCGAGVALADMTALWTDLLVRKSSLDLSGNGINHPNDFGHRLYAQVILALLVPPMTLTAIPSVGSGTSANDHDAASE